MVARKTSEARKRRILKVPKRGYGKCCVVLVGRLKRPKFGSLPEYPVAHLIEIILLVFDVLLIARHLEILLSQIITKCKQGNYWKKDEIILKGTLKALSIEKSISVHKEQ